MSFSSDLPSYIDAMNLCACNYDKKIDKVIYGCHKNDMIVKDTSFDVFLKKLCEIYTIDYDKNLLTDMLKFILDSNLNKMSFFALSGNVKKAISISKTNISENNIGLVFENLDDKKESLEYIDPLTATFQKHAFINYVKQRYQTDGKPYTLMIMDIDNFKGINDTYGHNVGDEILQGVAQVLKKNLKNGIVGRYGGDEFVCVSYQSTQYQDVWNLLYKITHDIYNVGILFDHPIDVSITVGVSRFGVDGDNYEDLFVKADRALYRGKRKGKNCFIIYDDQKHKNIQVDSNNKTIIDDRNENYSVTQIIANMYDFMNREESYIDIMNDISEYIVHLYKVDRCVIYMRSFDNYEYPLTYAYHLDEKEMSQDKRIVANWKEHEMNKVVSFIQVPQLKDINPDLYNELEKDGIYSLLRKDIYFNDNEIGAIELDNFTRREWTVEEKNAIIVIAEFLSVYLYKMNENMYLEHKSVIDNVTNTLKYERFISSVSKDLKSNTKRKVLYYFNLNKFKVINDVFSYKTGDLLLRKLADSIKEVIKVKDMITRLSGDRFLVYTDYESDEVILDNFKNINEILKSTEFPNNGIKDYIDLSCGVYVSDGTENVPSALIDNANIARKVLKDNGKKGILIYSNEIASDYQFKRNLETYFTTALRNKEFKVYLQPKVDITNGNIIGAEALSRWKYENNKMIHPADYIPILERTNQIENLDIYVFEYICDYLTKLKQLGKKLIPISINISRSIHDLYSFIETLENIRKKYDIDPKYLELEITESMINDTNNMTSITKIIHNLGYGISVDDFGSGYSNLKALIECEFDVLKIDKSLCSDGNDKSDAILDVIVELSSKLGFSVLCEGVETKAQESNLLLKNIKIAQGFLYDRPISLSEFTNKYL